MVSTKFVATQQSDGSESITLLRERPGGLFKRASSETVSVSEWPKVAPEAGQAALALARSFDQEGQIIEDRKRAVEGKSVSVRVDHGGRRVINKQKKRT